MVKRLLTLVLLVGLGWSLRAQFQVHNSFNVNMTGVTGAINKTETPVLITTIPASYIQAGTTLRIVAYGTSTSTAANTTNFRIRWGTTGGSSDTQIGILTTTAATSGTNIPFRVEFLITFQSTTVIEVSGVLLNNGVTGTANAAVVVAAPVNTIAMSTSVQNILQLSYQTTSNTTTTNTFQTATIEVVRL